MRADAAPDTQALRGWQRRALVRYLAAQPRDFLAVATPGSGKTTFALRVAAELLAERHRRPGHRRGADRTPQDSVGAGRGPASASRWTRSSPTHPRRRRRSTTASSSPTPRSPATRRGIGCAPRTAARWWSSTRSTTAATRRAGARRSARRSTTPPAASRSPGTPFRSDDSAIPFVTYAARRRRTPALAGRPHLRLRRSAGRRRGAPGGVPGLLRRGALARQRRRGARGPPR